MVMPNKTIEDVLFGM